MRLLVQGAILCAVVGTAFALALGVSVGLSQKPPLVQDQAYGRMITASDGTVMRLGLARDDKYRLRASLDQIAPWAVEAALQYEDRFFFWHPGVNPFSLFRACASLLPGQRRVGASTITMQVARLRFGINTRRLSGKLRQIWQALVLERHYSKQDILEAYFQLAPYGGNIEGIEAASVAYFGKSASALTLQEARALAVTPQNPQARNPYSGEQSRYARMLIAKDGSDVPPIATRNPRNLPFLAPHISQELLNQPLDSVKSTIQPDLQKALERAVTSHVAMRSLKGVRNACALLVDSANMDLVALVGSASFFEDGISGQVDGTRARRSPGSTLKPFIYARALDEGLIHPLSILPDAQASFGGYFPENFDSAFRGPINARDALQSSRNLPAIHLANRLSPPGLYGLLRQAGVQLDHGPDHYGLAIALGGAEVSMRELAALYAALANGGVWRNLRIYNGQEQAAPRRLVSPEAAWLTMRMLWRPDCTVRYRGGQLPVLYKTGTSNRFRDAWTAGYIGRYVLVVWVGDFDNKSGTSFVGAETALPLFMRIAGDVASMRGLEPFNLTPPDQLSLSSASVCTATGDIFRGQCRDIEQTYLIPGVSPIKDSGILRQILVDNATGLRACVPEHGRNKRIWWEFWPSDMKEIFEIAGIAKPDPPAFMPGCESPAFGNAPRIVMPAAEKIVRRASEPLWLQAAADADANTVYWYSKSRYLGSSRPGEMMRADVPLEERIEIMAVDDQGRSARETFEVINVR